MKRIAMIAVIFSFFTLQACSPKVGSDEWCGAMKEKPKGEWSANDAADFTKHCVFK